MVRTNKRSLRPYPDLASWRAALNCSQREAARYLGISQQHYSKLERRTNALPFRKAKDVMAMTGVPIEVLCEVA